MSTQPRVIHDNPAERQPMTARDADFCAALAHSAGTRDSDKLIWRAQRAWPYLVTGRITDAANRLWVVPSATREGVRYHLNLKTGACYSFNAAGAKVPCPHKRGAGVAKCAHYTAAERAEVNMFGGDAAKYFAPFRLVEVA